MDVNWDTYSWMWKVVLYFSAIFLFLTYPFLVVFDSIFRDSNILFISPEKLQSVQRERETTSNGLECGNDIEMTETTSPNEEQREGELCESNLFGFFRLCMHRPLYRMFITGLLDIIFLLFLFLHIYDVHDGMSESDFSYYPTIITFTFIANYLFENIVDIWRLKWSFFSSKWTIYSLCNNVLLSTGGLMAWKAYGEEGDHNRANLGGNHQLNIGMTLISLGASMSFFRIIRMLLLHRKIGPVIICIIQIMRDVLYVCIIFSILYFSFSVGLWSMFKPFQNCKENKSKYCVKEDKLLGNQKLSRNNFSDVLEGL